MHPEQMLKRAPHSPMAGTGWLHGWRLTFGGEDIGWEGALEAGRLSAVFLDDSDAHPRVKDRMDLTERLIAGKVPDIVLKPRDILYVPKSVGKRAALRTMEAAVQTVTGIVIYRR